MSQKTLALAFLNVFAIGLTMAQNGPNVGSNNNGYLALGDSVPFGYNPLVQPPDLSDYFGYPSIISAIIQNSLLIWLTCSSCAMAFRHASLLIYPAR